MIFDVQGQREKERMARLERLELPTRCLEGSCSIHLSYRRARLGSGREPGLSGLPGIHRGGRI